MLSAAAGQGPADENDNDNDNDNKTMKFTTFAGLAALAALATSPLAHAQNADRRYLGFSKLAGSGIDIATSDGHYRIKPYAPNIVETSFVPEGEVPDER